MDLTLFTMDLGFLLDLLPLIGIGGAITTFHTANTSAGDATDASNLDEVIP